MTPTVAYPLLGTVFLLFFALSRHTQVGHTIQSSRRMSRGRVVFDPLIEEIERRAEGGGLGDRALNADPNGSAGQDSDPFSDEHDEMEEFFSEEGRLNITERLVYLFPLLDSWPRDGRISSQELEYWVVGQALDRMAHRTKREMQAHDKDGDGAVTLREYLSHLSDKDIENNNMLPGQAGWWKERFNHADFNGDGMLNFTEFRDFLHPEDSNRESIRQWLQKDKIREMDRDGDGRLNFAEFRDRAYNIYKNGVELEYDHLDEPYYIPSAEEKFAELDGNKDRYLSDDEMGGIMHHIFPGELALASYYTNYLIREADDDKDGNLSLQEMLDHERTFYGSLREESTNDYENRDELR
ncbi:uncharacterized protein LOC131231398 [Magnolia sinica]|uniref:uncharacterized protein LOC131231398 n=1 Tax=Magnolia sinica TaxID=86752 RepID=UPI00265B4172|nr:uncharacterized protein LOC131231398 [Magnolia sinica]